MIIILKCKKKIVSLSLTKALHCSGLLWYNAMKCTVKARGSVVSIENNRIKKKLNKSDLSVEASFEMYLIKFVDNYKIDGAVII